MTRIGLGRAALLAATALAASPLPTGPAWAQDTSAQLQSIESQIKALQSELARMKQQLSARDGQVRAAQQQASQAKAQAQAAQQQATQTQAQVQQAAPALAAAAAAPPEPKLPLGTFKLGGVTVTLGGFIDVSGIFRTRNEVSDLASSWSGIPLKNTAQAHENEFRGSARASRVSLLVTGKPDDVTTLTAYGEMDFQAAAGTANSNSTNSYNPRLRLAYAQYDRSDWGLHVLGGQEWTLLTMNKVGISARQENIPGTIDQQYLPGFTYARQAQIRVAKDFDDKKFWLAASIESPQTVYAATGPNGNGVSAATGTVNNTNTGGTYLNPTANYSDDVAPDIVVKAAADPGFGHYEVYGVMRFLHDRVSVLGSGSSHTALAGGGGAGFIIPVVPKYVDLQGSFLAGYGIGRYGAGGLPDATISGGGAPSPIGEVQAMIGVTGHPTPAIDVYTYIGTEQESRDAFVIKGKGYGYGSPLYTNSGCDTELAPAATCVGNTSGLTQGTIGAWWRFYKGPMGTMQTGLQYSYTQRQIFKGVGGAPASDESVILASLRYFPFQ